jgi:hypothetical protein
MEVSPSCFTYGEETSVPIEKEVGQIPEPACTLQEWEDFFTPLGVKF